MRIILALSLIMALTACLPAAEPWDPQMTAEGVIRCGDKELRLANGHIHYTVDGRRVADIYPCWGWPAGGYGEGGYGDAEGRHDLDAPLRTITYRAAIKGRKSEQDRAAYSCSMALAEDGLVRCRIAFQAPGEIGDGKMVQVRFPGLVLDGTTIEAGADPVRVAPSTGTRRDLPLGSGTQAVFFAGDPDRMLRLTTERCDPAKPRSVADLRLDTSMPRMEYRIFFDRGQVAEFLLDIRAMSGAKKADLAARRTDAFDPYEFARFNQVLLPNYRASRNLIQNPSFEEGWHGFMVMGNPANGDAGYLAQAITIDDAVAYHGRRSLRFQFRPDRGSRPGNIDNFVGMVAPYAFQFRKGVRYSFSCYAKSEQEGLPLSAVVVSKDWGQWMKGGPTFSLGREWKRYSAEFVPSGDIGQFYLGIPWWDQKALRSIKDPTVNLWVDAIQFEEGPATGFTLKPLSVSLVRTSAVLSLREAKTLALDCLNNTGGELKADLSVAVLDGFKNQVFARTFPGLSLPATGCLPLDIPVPEAMDYAGRYTVRVGIADGAGYRDWDSYAIAVIEPFDRDRFRAARNLKLFGFTGTPAGDLARNTRLCREIGIGALQTTPMLPVDAGHDAAVTGEGILLSTGMFGNNWSTTVDPRFPVFHRMLATATLDDAVIAKIYDFLPGFFRTYRHHRYWKYLNEPASGGHAGAVCDPAQNVAFMARIHPIIKREIPDAVVISSDPANNFDAGRKWLDAVLAAGGARYFDVLAIHPYREKPERPSLERDSEEFIELARRHGFTGPLWYTEGGYFPLLNIPRLGVGPNLSCSTDSMRLTGFTEDGMGDRRGLAYHLRTVLICLRYADRIGMFLNHHIGLAIDAAKGMPTELGAGYNALANRLADARFRRAFPYADSVRAYLFDDGHGGAVAALWDCDDALERGERAPYRFVLAAQGLAVTDTFGRPLKAAAGGGFPVDFMPVFISSPDAPALAAALQGSRLAFDAAEAVTLALRPSDARHLVLTLANRDAAAFAGRVDWSINGRRGSATVAIPALASAPMTIPLDGIADPDAGRLSLEFQADLLDASGRKVKSFAERLTVLVCRNRAESGGGDRWSGLPEARIGTGHSDIIEYAEKAWRGPDDLSAAMRLAWNDAGLRLQVRVTDDVFVPAPTVTGAWAYDSLQVFIDAFKDGTPSSLNMDDDYAYMIAKTPRGDEVYRNQTPNRQIAWLDNGVVEPGVAARIARDEVTRTTTYEVTFPAKYLVPVALKRGGVIGLGVMVNDADDPTARRTCAMTTANGQEAWQKPYNLSFLVFE